MGLETPVGRTVHAGGGESTINAQLSLAGLNVVGDLLQGLEIGDVGQLIAGLLQQSLVDDDAECFVAVADRQRLAVFTLEVESVGGHLVHDGGAVQRIAVVAVGVDGA